LSSVASASRRFASLESILPNLTATEALVACHFRVPII